MSVNNKIKIRIAKRGKKNDAAAPVRLAPDYITLAEFVSRRHEQDLLKDPLAKPTYHGAINRLADDGVIEFYWQGKHKFIDWNKYKDILIRSYGKRKK